MLSRFLKTTKAPKQENNAARPAHGYSGSGNVGVMEKFRFAVIAAAQLPARVVVSWNDSSVRIILQLYVSGCRFTCPSWSLSHSPKIETVLLG